MLRSFDKWSRRRCVKLGLDFGTNTTITDRFTNTCHRKRHVFSTSEMKQMRNCWMTKRLVISLQWRDLVTAQKSLDNVSGGTFNFPGRYEILKPKALSSTRQRSIFPFLTLAWLTQSYINDTDCWSVTTVKRRPVRKCEWPQQLQ